MAKTKLLADIGRLSTSIANNLDDLHNQLDDASEVTLEHWKIFTNINKDMVELNNTVAAMEKKIQSWNGSTKLITKMKNQKKLSAARDEAQQKFAVLKTNHVRLISLHRDYSALMADLHG